MRIEKPGSAGPKNRQGIYYIYCDLASLTPNDLAGYILLLVFVGDCIEVKSIDYGVSVDSMLYASPA